MLGYFDKLLHTVSVHSGLQSSSTGAVRTSVSVGCHRIPVVLPDVISTLNSFHTKISACTLIKPANNLLSSPYPVTADPGVITSRYTRLPDFFFPSFSGMSHWQWYEQKTVLLHKAVSLFIIRTCYYIILYCYVVNTAASQQ